MNKPNVTRAAFQELFKKAKRLEGHSQHNPWLYANVHGLMRYPEDGDKRSCFTIKLLQDIIVGYDPELKAEFHALLQKQYGEKLVDILMAIGKKSYETDFAAAENAGIVVGTVRQKRLQTQFPCELPLTPLLRKKTPFTTLYAKNQRSPILYHV